MNNKVYSYIRNVGWNNTVIELVEQFNADNYQQARMVEDKYIRQYLSDPKCLNTNRSCITDAERLDLVRKNNAKISAIRNTIVNCPCGMMTTNGRRRQHESSYKHKHLIAINTDNKNIDDKIEPNVVDCCDSELSS